MKKSERLNGLVFALKERGRLSAKALSDIFEVSERTIYRDIDALSQLKVPITAYEGTGGGYEIDQDYFMPSIKLTEHESIMLLMLLKLGDEINFPDLKGDYTLLKSKINNTLDDVDLERIHDFLDKVSFYVSNVIPKNYDKGIMSGIIDAFLQVKEISFTYYHPAKDEYIKRRVAPNDLHFDGGAWYVSGYCYLRNEKRIFRLDRMYSVEILDVANTFYDKRLTSIDDKYRSVVYTFEIESRLYRLLKDNFYFSDCEIIKTTPQMVIKLRTNHERLITNMILEHPEEITLLGPASYQEKIAHIISKLHQKYLK